MTKNKTKFVCQSCGHEQTKWMGKCPACNQWNSLVEEMITSKTTKQVGLSTAGGKPVSLRDIKGAEGSRLDSGINEFNRVLGGGVTKGSLILVGGDPGIGKSTLLMQVAASGSMQGKKVLYVSGEESPSQLKIRANRLLLEEAEFNILTETNMHIIKSWIESLQPHILIIDSIQTMYDPDISSVPGSVSQVKEATAAIMNITKNSYMTTFLIGHVTKQGSIAGPRVLEHMVDTVLYFEGDNRGAYRILRAVKNRFGSTNEIGVFEMNQYGLKEVANPSELFIEDGTKDAYGTVVTASIEGTRPLLVEIQALVSPSAFGQARRVTTGVDANRVSMLMAVMEKKLGIQLQNFDAYINVIGGLQLRETSVDLAVMCAIISSFREKPIHHKMVIIGEVGLTGEIRGVSQLAQRIGEAKKLGFNKVIVPKRNSGNLGEIKEISVLPIGHIEETITHLW